MNYRYLYTEQKEKRLYAIKIFQNCVVKKHYGHWTDRKVNIIRFFSSTSKVTTNVMRVFCFLGFLFFFWWGGGVVGQRYRYIIELNVIFSNIMLTIINQYFHKT